MRSLRPFALFDTQQHARRVDVIDLEVRDLGHTQACTLGDAERSLVIEAGCGFEQPPSFLDAEYIWQFAVITGDRQSTRQIPALQRHQEEEPQRRYRAVDGRGAATPSC